MHATDHTHIQMPVHTQIQPPLPPPPSTHTCTSLSKHTNTHGLKHTHTHTYTHTHTHTHTRTYILPHTRTDTHPHQVTHTEVSVTTQCFLLKWQGYKSLQARGQRKTDAVTHRVSAYIIITCQHLQTWISERIELKTELTWYFIMLQTHIIPHRTQEQTDLLSKIPHHQHTVHTSCHKLAAIICKSDHCNFVTSTEHTQEATCIHLEHTLHRH